MKAWMIKGPTGNLIPSSGNLCKSGAISEFARNCDWLENPTWEKLQEDGFSVVKVEIKEPT